MIVVNNSILLSPGSPPKPSLNIRPGKVHLNAFLSIHGWIALPNQLLHPVQCKSIKPLTLLIHQRNKITRKSLFVAVAEMLLDTLTQRVNSATDFLGFVEGEEMAEGFPVVGRSRGEAGVTRVTEGVGGFEEIL
jgi:hypothetical protein